MINDKLSFHTTLHAKFIQRHYFMKSTTGTKRMLTANGHTLIWKVQFQVYVYNSSVVNG